MNIELIKEIVARNTPIIFENLFDKDKMSREQTIYKFIDAVSQDLHENLPSDEKPIVNHYKGDNNKIIKLLEDFNITPDNNPNLYLDIIKISTILIDGYKEEIKTSLSETIISMAAVDSKDKSLEEKLVIIMNSIVQASFLLTQLFNLSHEEAITFLRNINENMKK